MANPNTAPVSLVDIRQQQIDALDKQFYVGNLPSADTSPTVQPPYPTPYSWVSRPEEMQGHGGRFLLDRDGHRIREVMRDSNGHVLLDRNQEPIVDQYPIASPRVLEAPKAFVPKPEAQKRITPITLDPDRRPSESVFAAGRANNDAGLTGVSWKDSNGETYKVSSFRPELRRREEFYNDKGAWNKAALGMQKGLNHAPWPIRKWPDMFIENASLRGFHPHGGPGPNWEGLAKMRHDTVLTGYRTVDIYDAKGGLKEIKTFHSDAELQAYIDSNTVHAHGYVDNVEERRIALYGPNKHGHGGSNFHGGFDYLDQAPVALDFQNFKIGDAEPPAKPKVDFIPYHGSNIVPIQVIDAINEGKRLGIANEGGNALVGFTWNNGRQEQAILRSVMKRKSSPARQYTGESTLEPAVIIETTFVTPAHNVHPKDRDSRRGGSVQKRQIVMTLSELQDHFNNMAKAQATAGHDGGRHPHPINARFALPELEPDDIVHRTLRQQELAMQYGRNNNILNDPQFNHTIGRLIVGATVELEPTRQPGTPRMSYRRALTLMSKYDQAGWEDRARNLWETYGRDNPDARHLMKTINAVGEEAAAISAKGVLTDIHKTLDLLGLQIAADKNISMSDILVVMSRRREFKTTNPDDERSDGLTNADPFSYSEAGLRARREITDMFIASVFNEATLEPLPDPDPAKAGQIAMYVRSKDLLDQMPKNFREWMLSRANRVGLKREYQLSPSELVFVGEALSNFWVDPNAYNDFSRERFAQKAAEQASKNFVPIA